MVGFCFGFVGMFLIEWIVGCWIGMYWCIEYVVVCVEYVLCVVVVVIIDVEDCDLFDFGIVCSLCGDCGIV